MTFEAAGSGPRDARTDAALRAVELRLRAYLACLAGAFLLHLFVHVPSQGLRLLLPGVLVLGALGVALVAGPRPGARLLVQLATLTAAAVALLVPLASELAAGRTLPAAIHGTTVWPQILVALFASRVLAELAELRLIFFFRDPLGGGGSVSTQSMAGAVVMGCCLTLVFYQIAGGIVVAPERLDPWAIALRAATGQTAIHAAIVVLFFVVIAAIVDAWLLAVNESLVLGAVRRLFRDATGAAGTAPRRRLEDLLTGQLGQFSHSRAYEFVRGALRGDGGAARRHSVVRFHAASRRLVRALLSFLPLLGFLGTVIGLTAAVGGLPAELVPEGGASLDIGASLLGLALKFETTLLGLAGALAASLLLSLLEKRESEIEAECWHVAEATAGNADYGIGGDAEARIPAAVADIFLALVAVVIMMLIWLAPAIRAPAMLAPPPAAADLRHAEITIDGRSPVLLVAEPEGLRIMAPAERLVPLAALPGDAGLAAALAAAVRAGTDVMLLVEPDGQETSFLFAAAASAAGVGEIVQLRLDDHCGFVTEAAPARLCRGRGGVR